jgi:hypothetical protein
VTWTFSRDLTLSCKQISLRQKRWTHLFLPTEIADLSIAANAFTASSTPVTGVKQTNFPSQPSSTLRRLGRERSDESTVSGACTTSVAVALPQPRDYYARVSGAGGFGVRAGDVWEDQAAYGVEHGRYTVPEQGTHPACEDCR